MAVALGRAAAGYLARTGVREYARTGNFKKAVTKVAKQAAMAVGGAGAAVGAAGGYALGKRKRTRQPSRYKKRGRTVNVKSQGELTGPVKVTSKLGRKSYKTTLGKLNAMSMVHRVLRWQQVNPMNRAVGTAIPGANVLFNSTNATLTDCPVHFYSLTATRNAATATNPATVGWTLQILDNGTLSFGQRVSQANTGGNAADGRWQFESQTQPAVTLGKRFIQSKWYDIRFLLYGARSQPTQYEISVIRFREEYLDPLENPANPQEAADRQALYQNLAMSQMVNPILPGPGTSFLNKKYKVIKQLKVTIQPSLNTEVDATPSSKIVKFFIKDGRVLDYMYHGDGFTGTGSDDKLNSTQWIYQPTASTDFSEVPLSNYRYWLMIRALNTTTATPDNSNTPSYDLIIRKGESVSS